MFDSLSYFAEEATSVSAVLRERPARRKVLIVEDDSAIQKLLMALLALGGEVPRVSEQSLAKISRELFDSVILDLRCSGTPPADARSGVQEIRPTLVGRVLVITGQVGDPDTLESIARRCR